MTCQETKRFTSEWSPPSSCIAGGGVNNTVNEWTHTLLNAKAHTLARAANWVLKTACAVSPLALILTVHRHMLQITAEWSPVTCCALCVCEGGEKCSSSSTFWLHLKTLQCWSASVYSVDNQLGHNTTTKLQQSSNEDTAAVKQGFLGLWSFKTTVLIMYSLIVKNCITLSRRMVMFVKSDIASSEPSRTSTNDRCWLFVVYRICMRIIVSVSLHGLCWDFLFHQDYINQINPSQSPKLCFCTLSQWHALRLSMISEGGVLHRPPFVFKWSIVHLSETVQAEREMVQKIKKCLARLHSLKKCAQ